MESGPLAESPAPAKTSNYWRWVLTGVHWIVTGVGVLAIIAATIICVRWLASIGAGKDQGPEVSLEDEWDNTIRNLGIQPFYPPQEDITVGDLFATVVDDEQYHPDATIRNRIVSTTPFLGRSTKIGHVDVSALLETAYAEMPFFSDTGAANKADASQRQGGASGSAQPPETPLFGKHEERRVLPRAAFPGLSIHHSGSAAAGVGGGTRGWFGYGAANQTSQKLTLGAVETYGLDVIAAGRALDQYCKKPETGDLCSEAVVRKYLQPVIGNHVFDKYVDMNTGEYRYSVTVQLIMVNRVYLAGEIFEQRSDSSAEGSDAAAVPPAGRIKLSPTPPADGAKAAPEDRTGEVENRLAGLQESSAVVYRSGTGTEVLLDQKFPRPIVIGYRSVPYEFASSENKESNLKEVTK
jgi:hypothetical protein